MLGDLLPVRQKDLRRVGRGLVDVDDLPNWLVDLSMSKHLQQRSFRQLFSLAHAGGGLNTDVHELVDVVGEDGWIARGVGGQAGWLEVLYGLKKCGWRCVH